MLRWRGHLRRIYYYSALLLGIHYLVDLGEVWQLHVLDPFRGFAIVTSIVLLQQIEQEAFKWRKSVVICLGRCRAEIWHETVLLRMWRPIVGFLDMQIVDRLVWGLVAPKLLLIRAHVIEDLLWNGLLLHSLARLPPTIELIDRGRRVWITEHLAHFGYGFTRVGSLRFGKSLHRWLELALLNFGVLVVEVVHEVLYLLSFCLGRVGAHWNSLIVIIVLQFSANLLGGQVVKPLQPEDLVDFDVIVAGGLVFDHVESVLVIYIWSGSLSWNCLGLLLIHFLESILLFLDYGVVKNLLIGKALLFLRNPLINLRDHLLQLLVLFSRQ